jgi:hypothetical protein
MAFKPLSAIGTGGKMILPGRPGPERKHHCPSHDAVMAPVKVWGVKGVMFECKEGCRLGKYDTVLK